MLATVILLSISCGYVQGSVIHPVAVPGTAPVVTAASSQYFERTFNRLVPAPANPVIPVAPAFPVLPAPPILPSIPIAPASPVVIDAKTTTSLPVSPTAVQPQSSAVDPNVAIAIATAHAAAPVATILLPPYPFGFPPTFGFIPQTQQPLPSTSENPINNRETTTRRTTTVQLRTTEREQEATTPVPSNIDNSFAQPLPSNQNVNFRQYLAPPAPESLPPPTSRPQKVKTNVEVVPVPLAYIAPPPLDSYHHHHQHHHHHHHHHQALKVVPHIHTFIPKTKIIIRPATSSYRVRTVKVPVGFATYGPPKLVKKIVKRYPQNIVASRSRDIESTTFHSINRPFTKPPRV
ncbi:unnamed protein product, partial [Brenthis ino]